MFSTHYRRPRRPDDLALRLLDLLARQAADIIDRAQAEEALRESKQKFIAIFEHAPVAIALSRMPEGIFVDVNEAFETLFRFSREEAVGRTSLELGIAPDPRVREVLLTQIHQQGFAHQVELEYRDRSGNPIHLLGNIDLVTIGKEPYILNTFERVTPRRWKENKTEK